MEDKRKKLFDEEDVDSILARYGIDDDALEAYSSAGDLTDVDQLLSNLLGPEERSAASEKVAEPLQNRSAAPKRVVRKENRPASAEKKPEDLMCPKNARFLPRVKNY